MGESFKVYVEGVGVVEDYEKYDVEFWELLPHWAEDKATKEEGILEMFSHMPTKDGRNCGNGIVVNIETCAFTDLTLYTIKTEVGNTMKVSYDEAMELFHKPTYIKTKEAFTEMCKVWEIYGNDL